MDKGPFQPKPQPLWKGGAPRTDFNNPAKSTKDTPEEKIIPNPEKERGEDIFSDSAWEMGPKLSKPT